MNWLGNGKAFACSYSDGSIVMWSPKCETKPEKIFYVHGELFFYQLALTVSMTVDLYSLRRPGYSVMQCVVILAFVFLHPRNVTSIVVILYSHIVKCIHFTREKKTAYKEEYSI